MSTTFVSRTFAATAAAITIYAAFAGPTSASAASSGAGGRGKMHLQDVSLSHSHPGGMNALMMDGSVR
jgi:prepilin-type processing-associated H-X9-DG protein